MQDIQAVLVPETRDHTNSAEFLHSVQGLIPLVYLANGNKIYFKNMLTDSDGDYVELGEMHSPKKMLQLIGKKSEYGALPRIEKRGLRDCQYDAEVNLEKSLKQGKKGIG